ncbi:MAG TPA: hypothetical protein VJT72_24155 [Pseudonocardiaceae bacterium]|nr:hypothetical protein [Pseudonocardiaceae bacterium]
MDEQLLRQVFRDAAEEPPPPASFGSDEVVAASRHATARRRGLLGSATLLGVAVLAGGLLAGGPALRDDTAGPAATAPGVPLKSDELRALDAPHCGPVDAELAANLTALLTNRGRMVSGPAGEVPEPCPQPGSRAAAVPVPGGVLAALLVPPGEPELRQLARPDGYSVTLADGRTLTVSSMPGAPGQPAPLVDELPDLARELAAAL